MNFTKLENEYWEQLEPEYQKAYLLARKIIIGEQFPKTWKAKKTYHLKDTNGFKEWIQNKKKSSYINQ